jgi:hypothetical protein
VTFFHSFQSSFLLLIALDQVFFAQKKLMNALRKANRYAGAQGGRPPRGAQPHGIEN